MPVTQIAKELGAMWKKISDKDKAKYEAMAAKVNKTNLAYFLSQTIVNTWF